jgi:hypothetical protein
VLVSCAGSVRCANVKYREEEKKKEAHLIGNAVANENGKWHMDRWRMSSTRALPRMKLRILAKRF